jgi:hypothetical protein
MRVLRSTLLSFAAMTALLGQAPAKAAAEPDYPFLGKWDCTVSTFILTADTWDSGGEASKIEEIQEGTDGSWNLLFADDYVLSLFGFAKDGTKMEFLSSASGDSYPCTRLAD